MMKQYDSYKDSGVEWIGKIPSHWEVCRFKDFAFLRTDASDDDNKIGLENIEGKTGRFIETSTEFEGNGTAFHEGDIVYGKLRPYLQKVWLATFDGNAVGDFFVFRARENCRNRLLFYIMISDGFTCMCNGATFGAKMPRVSSDFIRGMHFYLPPIIEQDAIASYLDEKCGKIDKAIATQEKRLELLKELRQNIITQAVTRGINPNAPLKDSGVEWIGEVPEHWEVRKLKNICKSEKYAIKTGPFGSQLKGEELQPDGDVRVYSQRNVIDNSFDDTNFYVSNAKAKDLESFYTQPSDLLVTSRGTIGKCAILPADAPMGILHPCLIAMRVDTNVCDIKFVQIYMNESICFGTNVYLNSNATTIEVIYTDTLKNINIPVPPLSEQQEIVSYIKSQTARLDTSIEKAEHQIELLQELKQSIITEVVTGKRKVC